MNTCPKCGSSELVRSHRNSAAERLRSRLFGSLPFCLTCKDCRHRFWRKSRQAPKALWHWPMGALALIILAALAYHFALPVTDQKLTEPRPPAVRDRPQAEPARTPAPEASEPPASGPAEAKAPAEQAETRQTEIPAEAQKLLDALAKAPPPPPMPPPPPPPVQKTELPPVRPGHAVVPNLVGYPKSYAKWVLGRQGLRYKGILRGPVAWKNHGKVFAQDPAPGRVIPLGGEVTVRSFVAKPEEAGKYRTAMPDLSGLRQEQADLAVRRAGLIPHLSPVLVRDKRWEGMVAGQEPAPGAELAPDAQVRILIYSSELPREVPFLLRQRLSLCPVASGPAGLPLQDNHARAGAGQNP